VSVDLDFFLLLFLGESESESDDARLRLEDADLVEFLEWLRLERERSGSW
jgi:hypothetical protein